MEILDHVIKSKTKITKFADLVTEMKEIKHPFKSGIKAKKGMISKFTRKLDHRFWTN